MGVRREGQFETPLSPSGPASFAGTGAFLKYVVRPGVLQDKTGPSIATEFRPLLPEVNGSRGTGLSWAGIVSQDGTGHGPFQLRSQPDARQQGEGFVGRIVEGPAKWKIRQVAEVDKVWTQTESRSVLAGAIWQVRDNLSFAGAYRYGVVNGQPVNEIRAGVTFAFDVGHDTAASIARGGVRKVGLLTLIRLRFAGRCRSPAAGGQSAAAGR